MKHKLYLNDLGIVNSLGYDKASVTASLINNQTGLKSKHKLISDKVTYVGKVFDELPKIPKNLMPYDCRNNQMLLHSCLQILPTIKKMIDKYGANRIAIVLGTSTSGIDNGENAFIAKKQSGEFPENFYYKQQETGIMSEFLKKFLGLQNIAYTISTACSSSGKAFASATRLIKQDICDVVLVGGCDTLCELTLNGFDCLEAISENICLPFSKNRDGINIGESAAIFILSKDPSEICLMGVGESSDGYHITAPEPNGSGAILAMNSALDKANLQAKQIGYLNLHGTATNLNDAMESNAVSTVFDRVKCSSTKHLTGHTLGAAAATEIGLCWLLISNKYNPDKKLPKQNVTNENLSTNIGIITDNTKYENPYFMSNSFAFGGNNVSVIIGKNDYV